MKLLYRFVYTDMIRRLRARGWKTQRINTVLTALGLPEIGVPKMKNPPKRPKNQIPFSGKRDELNYGSN